MPVLKSADVRGDGTRKVCPRLHTRSPAERRRDGCTGRVAAHESFAIKSTCVTGNGKQRIRFRFVLSIADTDQLKMP